MSLCVRLFWTNLLKFCKRELHHRFFVEFLVRFQILVNIVLAKALNSKYKMLSMKFSADLVTFTEEILKGKFHFLCSA